jgi:hypothetical protein
MNCDGWHILKKIEYRSESDLSEINLSGLSGHQRELACQQYGSYQASGHLYSLRNRASDSKSSSDID